MCRTLFQEYRDDIRDLYDGPRGAVLAVGSLVSLHEPLIGHCSALANSTSRAGGGSSTSAPERDKSWAIS